MELYLVRHGVAVDADSSLADEARPLSARGREEFGEEVRGLERIGARFDQLLHSPLLRAMETAELLMPLLSGESAVSERLTRAPSPELLRELTGLRVALVGHEPLLSELAAWLATGSRETSPSFALEKGGIVVLEGDPKPGAMRISAFLPPRILRKLAH